MLVTESCRNAKVFCFDLSASDRKREAVATWAFETQGMIFEAPTVHADRVYVSSVGDGIYCLPLKPDADGQIRPLWRLPAERYADCRLSPLVWKNRAYVGLGLDGNAFCALDATTGAEVWRVSMPGPVSSAAALDGGRIYVATGYGSMLGDWRYTRNELFWILNERSKEDGRSLDAALAAVRARGDLWCLDAESGEVLWRYETPEAVVGAVAVDGDRVFFGSRDGQFHCLTTDGEVVCRRAFADPVLAPPAIGKELVYVQVAGRLYALRKNDLTVAWQITINEEETMSPPSLAQGVVYVGSKRRITAIGQLPGRQHQPAE
jgi:outer membrane protein assembly factor BamB